MQSRISPFHRLSERDADLGRGARISDFIRDAQSGRNTLSLESKQLPLALMPTTNQSSQAPGFISISFPGAASASAPRAETASGADARAYDLTSLANTLIAQAMAAVEQLVRLMSVNDEREKQLHLYDESPASIAKPSLEGVTRSAIEGCLASASALLGVTSALYNRSPAPTPQECVQESRELSELTKTAGRAAYRAALLIVDPEIQRVIRPDSRRPQKSQL